MSYKVNFDALDSLCININTQVSEWSSDINSISEKLNSILSGNHITGDGAENIKSYLQTVHVAIIQSLVSILQSHGQNCLMYKSDYQQNIDTSLHAVIKCEELFDIRNQLTTKRREMWSVDSNISDALTTVNDLIYNNLSSSDEMDELYGTINTSLLNLEGDIAELESNHLNTDFPEVQNMISALKIFINDQLSRSRAYLVEYTPQQLANSAVYADLFNANQVLVTSQSARADEFQIACEHENNRAELLEEEAAQIREEEGWWNAVAAVGTIVIGTVAIVCTAGMATPVVVTAVAAGSCSIAYGASNLVEAGQDIYYGSVGDATTVAFNPIRDTVFAGNQELYDIWGGISTTVAGFVVPVGQAYTTAKAAGSTTKVVVSTVGKAAAKEVAQDAFVSTASLGTGNVVMDITGDANVSRLFSLGTGFFAGGKTNQALDSLDNVSSTVRRLDNLDNVTDVTKTLDDVTIKQPQKLKSVESYSNWDDMKSAHKGMVTKFVQNNKPKYSPNVKKWFEKDGSLVIETLEDNTQVWKYTNKAGDSVSYIPKIVNGEEVKVPDFSDYLHPNGDISRVNIGKFSGDRAKDIETFFNMTGLDEIPEGYTLHHGIPNGVVELVETEIHREFTHIGGFSLFK